LYIGREKFYDTGPIIEMIKEHPGDIAQDYITVFEIFSQKNDRENNNESMNIFIIFESGALKSIHK
jgi:hypothetical protein